MKKSSRTVRVSLHQHLTDRDWELKTVDFAEVIERASTRLGPGGVLGIVDFFIRNREQKFEIFFDRLLGYKLIPIGENAMYLPGKDLFVIRAQESETREGHVLTIGLDTGVYVPNSRDFPLEAALDDARSLDAISVADHPFGFEGTGPYLLQHPEIVTEGKIDAAEINNHLAIYIPGRTSILPNWTAQRWHRRLIKQNPGLRFGALYGRDGHTPQEVGLDYTLLQIPEADQIMEDGDLRGYLRQAIRSNTNCRGQKSRTSYIDAARHISSILRNENEGVIDCATRVILGRRKKS